MRYWSLVLVLAMCLGCGSSEPAAPAASAAKPVVKKKPKLPAAEKPAPPPPAPKIPDDAFADVPAALDAIVAAADISDQAAMSKADQWMVQRGAAGLAPLGEVLLDDNAPLAKRIAASRALGQMGPAAKPALLKGLDSTETRIRVVSLEALGRIKPADQEIIATCLRLAQDNGDAELQRYAISALGKIGPAAKEAVPLLVEMRNSKKQSEIVRAEAHKSLKLIDERKGLMGLNEE